MSETTRKPKCPACGGTGQWWPEDSPRSLDCPACGGTGAKPSPVLPPSVAAGERTTDSVRILNEAAQLCRENRTLTDARWPAFFEYLAAHLAAASSPGGDALREAAPMRRVQQEDPMGCGVACLAMVSRRTYAEVRASLSPESRHFLTAAGTAGTTDHTILWWLNREGFWSRRSWMDGEGRRLVPTSGVAIMLTHDAHWVVLADGVVLDPARPDPLPTYHFRQAIEVLPPRASLPPEPDRNE